MTDREEPASPGEAHSRDGSDSTPVQSSPRRFPPSRTFQSLRNYNFRLFWFGQLFSLSGTWMQSIAQAWLVLEITKSPLALGTVTALQFLPVLVLTLFAGVLIDRVPKRRLIIVTQTVAMSQALVLGILVSTGQVQLWHIYILATVLGIVNSVDNPARQSFIIEMVGRDHLINAVGLNSTLFNMARIVGPALGGVVIARVGIAECFYLNALSFLAVLASLLLMRDSLLVKQVRHASGGMLRQLSEGIGYALRTPSVVVIVIQMAVIGTFGYNFTVVLPLLARDALDVGAEGFGALSTAMGLGSLLAALVMASARRTTQRTLFIGAVCFILFEVALATSTQYVVALGIMLLVGISGLAFTATANSLLQLDVPDNLRGRIMSLYTLLFLGSTPIGAMITGALASQWGIQSAILVESGICAVGILAAFLYYVQHKNNVAKGH